MFSKITDQTGEGFRFLYKNASPWDHSHFVQQMVDTIPVPVFIKDADHQYLAFNKAWEEFTGISRETGLQITLEDILERLNDPGLAEFHRQKDREVLENGGIVSYEQKLPHKDGTVRDAMFYKTAFFNMNGDLHGFLGLFMDLSAQKRSEEMLQYRLRMEESVAQISKLLISPGDPSWKDVLPFIGRALAADHAYLLLAAEQTMEGAQLYQWHQDKPGFDKETTRNQALTTHLIWRLREEQYTASVDESAIADHLAEIFQWLPIGSMASVPIFSANGASIGALVLGNQARDRIWLREDVQALQMVGEMIGVCWNRKQEEIKFHKAFNGSPNLIAIISMIRDRYVEVNRMFTETTGYDIKHIVNRSLDECVLAHNRSTLFRIKRMVQAYGSIRNQEFSFLNRLGQERQGLLSAELFTYRGEPCMMTTITDITERKEIEMEMSRLGQLNLVGEIAASFGHEVRNPMTTVRGFLQLLAEKEEYSSDKEYFTLMIEELDRANAIISEFLSLAKDKRADKTPQNLNHIIENVFPLISADAIAQEKYLKLDLHPIPNLMLDQKEVRQLLLNLVRNGIEAMSPGGTVTIGTRSENELVVLSVRDEGQGIDNLILDKIATPFFTTKDQGTGLGLSVCHSIAVRHDAVVEVQTSDNTGTTICVKFRVVDR